MALSKDNPKEPKEAKLILPDLKTSEKSVTSDGERSHETLAETARLPPRSAAPFEPPPRLPGAASPSSAASPSASSASASPKVSIEEPLRRFKLSDFKTEGDPLGAGAYGSVTKVTHKATGEAFAMKAIPRKKVLEHQVVPYLLREVRTHAKLRHPNIIQLHYYFEDETHIYILLEFAPGGSLFSLLRKRRSFPEAQAAKLWLDVARALDFLHRNGIVHRDLKPENILMCGNQDVAKLADFGWCAEISRDGDARNTFCGTWDYLSPEMVQSEPHDHRVDVWACGVLLYELLTGRAPFAAPNQVKAMQRVVNVDLKLPPNVSPDAGDLIKKLLVKEPEERLSLKEAARLPVIHRHILDSEKGFGTGSTPLKSCSLEEPRRASAEKAESQGGSPTGESTALQSPAPAEESPVRAMLTQVLSTHSEAPPPLPSAPSVPTAASLRSGPLTPDAQLLELMDIALPRTSSSGSTPKGSRGPSVMPWQSSTPAGTAAPPARSDPVSRPKSPQWPERTLPVEHEKPPLLPSRTNHSAAVCSNEDSEQPGLLQSESAPLPCREKPLPKQRSRPQRPESPEVCEDRLAWPPQVPLSPLSWS